MHYTCARPLILVCPRLPQYMPPHNISTPSHYIRPSHTVYASSLFGTPSLYTPPQLYTTFCRPPPPPHLYVPLQFCFAPLLRYSLFHTLYAPPHYTVVPIYAFFFTVYALLTHSIVYIALSRYLFQYEDLLREHTSFKIQLERCELELDLKERSLTDLRTALRESEERSRKIAQFVERQTEQIQHLEMTAKQAEQVSFFMMLL
jgi:hypothetical protein